MHATPIVTVQDMSRRRQAIEDKKQEEEFEKPQATAAFAELEVQGRARRFEAQGTHEESSPRKVRYPSEESFPPKVRKASNHGWLLCIYSLTTSNA